MPARRTSEHAPALRLRRVSLRRPRALLALAAVVAGTVAVSSSVGDGALPTASLPAFGATAGSGSLSTVAELGDINGDHIGDYAIGLPSATVAGSADAGIVDVFLGKPGALPATPTSLSPADASFQISGHAAEMLGYAVAGVDMNGDGLNDIAIGAPMAGAPSKSGGGAVYVVFGSADPASISTTALSFAGYTNATTSPATPSLLGSRYDGFQVNAHTGMSLAALPDVNGDGYDDLAVGAPDAALHRPGGGGVAVLYGTPAGVHITLNDLWENGYPYFFHVDLPDLDDQHVGASVASVGDMTGDHQPDIAIGAPQADPGGRTDAGSVWIISAHLPEVTGCLQATGLDASCPWIKLDNLGPGQGYRIDGAAAGDGLGSSLAGVGDQNGDGIRDLAIGEPGASPSGRAGAGAVVVVPGQASQSTRDLAVSPPLQTIVGAQAGGALGSSLAAAGDVDGDGRVDVLAGAPGESSAAGAAYLVRGAPGAVSDLGQTQSGIAPAGAGSMAGSQVAAGSAIDGSGADALVAAPGSGSAGAWFAVGGSGTPVLPPPPGTPVTPPATPPVTPPVTPPANPPVTPPVTTPAPASTAAGTAATGAAAVTPAATPSTTSTAAVTPKAAPAKKARKLPLCPLKKPKPRYRVVKGKRVKIKPAPCRPRPKTTAKTRAASMGARNIRGDQQTA